MGRSDMIFNIVFFIVLTSVMLQGTTLSVVADWLGLSQRDNSPKKVRLGEDMGYDAKNSLVELYLNSASPAAGKSIVELQLPKTSLIVLIDRGGQFVTPNGATVLEEDDKLMVMVDNDEELEKVEKVLNG